MQATSSPTPGVTIRVPSGFTAEAVYSVPQSQGSWVCLTVDAKGRLISSDQFGKLYRVTLGTSPAHSPRVDSIEVNLGSAQGLLWAFDSLYVVANRDKAHGGSGLYRLLSHDGGEHFDEIRLLRTIDGSGEHGPHAIVPGPD